MVIGHVLQPVQQCNQKIICQIPCLTYSPPENTDMSPTCLLKIDDGWEDVTGDIPSFSRGGLSSTTWRIIPVSKWLITDMVIVSPL